MADLWKGLLIFIVVFCILSAVFWIVHSVGLVGTTIVERKVFESSYQRKAGLSESIAQDEAAKAQIIEMLSNPNISQDTRHNLEAQLRAINIRLQTNRRLLNEGY